MVDLPKVMFGYHANNCVNAFYALNKYWGLFVIVVCFFGRKQNSAKRWYLSFDSYGPSWILEWQKGKENAWKFASFSGILIIFLSNPLYFLRSKWMQ